MKPQLKTWVILVSHRGLEPLWYGNIDGHSRHDAKRNARAFVARHLTDDAKIVRIAEGFLSVQFFGPQTDFDD